MRRGSRLHAALLLRLGFPRWLGRRILVLEISIAGRTVEVPLRHTRVGEKLYVVASFAANDGASNWLLRLRENPIVDVELPGGRIPTRARVLEPEETVEIWPLLLAEHPGYAREQRRKRHWLAVVELSPANE